jgi:hypothetical protein
MPDLTKLAACSAEMVDAGPQAILFGMCAAFPRGSNSNDAEETA